MMANIVNNDFGSSIMYGNKRLFIVLVVWIGAILLVVEYRNHSDFTRVVNQAIVNIDSRIRIKSRPATHLVLKTNTTLGADTCKGFDNEPLHPSTKKYFKKKPTIKCTTGLPNFLYVTEKGDFLKLDKNKIASHKAKVDYCQYASLKRANENGDFKILTSVWSKSFTDSIILAKDVEHIWGRCFREKTVVGSTYASIIRKNDTLEKDLREKYKSYTDNNKPKETLSVLILGIDGTSKLNFARHMPKTKSFLLNMGGIELYKLNKVGLNTFPNVLPLLTGYSETEIRKNWTDNQYLDKVNDKFLWEDAKNAGYRTSLILDRTKITAFHYLKKGWNKPTVHYNNRPVVVKSEDDKEARKSNRHCIGDQCEISLFYDYWLQLTRTFNNSKTTPYFGYSFFAHVTHDDINALSSIDDVYLDFFQKLVRQNCLNNTLIVFFSDHGNRFGSFRSTFSGMLEDSNPFMVFIFPPWFESKYPKIMASFRRNQHRVMTNFDIHATLKDVLNFQGDDIAKRPYPKNRTRGLSLFQDLPNQRTCEEAGIPIKYCNCRNFSAAGITPQITEKISKQFIEDINAKSKSVRSECVALTLNSTVSLMAIFATSEKFDFYQATIRTSPGGAVYEAVLIQNKKTGVAAVKGDIARTNMYTGQADCISDARIRPFCYCNNLLT